jgi:hypothetical protein
MINYFFLSFSLSLLPLVVYDFKSNADKKAIFNKRI